MAQTLHTKFFKLPVFAQFMLDSSFGGVSTTQVLIKLGSDSAQVSSGQVLTGISSHHRVRHYPLKYQWSDQPTNIIPGANFQSLTHLWTLSEFSGTRYDSKGGLNLAEIIPVGSSMEAANFKDYPTGLLRTAPFLLAEPFTIALWFYPMANATPAGSYLIQKTDSNANNLAFDWDPPSPSIINVFLENAQDQLISSASLNSWHSLVFTSDLTPSIRLYMDGANTDGGVGTTDSIDGALRVGLEVPNPSGGSARAGFPGLISNLMIFNSVLTQGQITTIWNGGVRVSV